MLVEERGTGGGGQDRWDAEVGEDEAVAEAVTWPYLGTASSVPRYQEEEGRYLRVAHMNVQGLRDEGKQQQLVAAMMDHHIGIFTLVDTRLQGRQATSFARAVGVWTAGHGGYEVLQAEAEGGGDGVAVLVARRWARHIQRWETYRGRIVRIPMAFRGTALTLMAVYAPPNPSNTGTGEEGRMTDWLMERVRGDSRRAERDEVLLMGDFNACPNPSMDRTSNREGAYRERRSRPESPLLDALVAEGMVDVWRHHFPGVEAFTWTSQSRAAEGERAPRARLDQAWSTPTLMRHVTGAGTGNEGWPVASDHVAVLVEIQAEGTLHSLPEVVPSTERGRKRLLPEAASPKQVQAYAVATTEVPESVARSVGALASSSGGEREVNQLCKKLESFLLRSALTHLPSRQEHYRPPRKAPRPYLSPGRRLLSCLHRRLVEARVRGEGEVVMGRGEERAVRASPIDARALDEEGRTPDGLLVVSLTALRAFRLALKKFVTREEAQQRRSTIDSAVRRRDGRFHEHIRETIQGVLGRRAPRRRIEVARTTDAEGRAHLEERGNAVKGVLREFFQDWTKPRSPQLHRMDERWRDIYAPLPNVQEAWYTGLMKDVELEELQTTLAGLSSKKAPGPTGIPNEIYAKMGLGGQQALLVLLNGIIRRGYLPRRWMRGTLIPIPKDQPWTGDLNRLRPIALLEAGRKILSSILTKRLGEIIHGRKVLTGGNYGFTPGQRTGDFVHVLRAVMDEAAASRQGLEVLLMDIKRAYDSVSWVSLAASLRRCRVPQGYISLLQGIYDHRTLQVASAHGPSATYHPETGLDQGEINSPLLWLIFYDPLLTALGKQGGGFPLGRRVSTEGMGRAEEARALKTMEVGYGAFADDLTLIAPTTEEIQGLADTCTAFFHLHDIEANAGKSVHVSRRRRHSRRWPPTTIHLGRPREAMTGGEVTDKRDSTETFRILGVHLTLEGTSKEPLRLVEEMVEKGAGMLRSKRISPQICAYVIDKVIIPAVIHRAIGNTFRPYQMERIEAKWNVALKHSLSLPKTFYTALTYRSEAVQCRRLMTAIDTSQLGDLTRRLHHSGDVGRATRISSLNLQERMSAHDSVLQFPMAPGRRKGYSAYLVERMLALGMHILIDPSNRLMRGTRVAPGRPIVPCLIPHVEEKGRKEMRTRGVTHLGDLYKWEEEEEEEEGWRLDISTVARRVKDNIPLRVGMMGRARQDVWLGGPGEAEWAWGSAWSREEEEDAGEGGTPLTIPRLSDATGRWRAWKGVEEALVAGEEVEIWTDGSYDQKRTRGGYGIVVVSGRAKGAWIMGAYHGSGSSSTLVEALAILHAIAATQIEEGRVVIKTDSENCIHMLKAIQEGKKEELARGYKGSIGRIWAMIAHLLATGPRRSMRAVKVLAHSGLLGNEEADRRAKEASAARGRAEVPQWSLENWSVGAREYSLVSPTNLLSPPSILVKGAHRSKEEEKLMMSLARHISISEGIEVEGDGGAPGETTTPEGEGAMLASTFLTSPMWGKIASMREDRARTAILTHWLKRGTGTLPSAAVLVEHHQEEDPGCVGCGEPETNRHVRWCRAWWRGRREGKRRLVGTARRLERETGAVGLETLMEEWGMGEGREEEERLAVYGGIPAGWETTHAGKKVPRKVREELLWTFHSGLRHTWRERCLHRQRPRRPPTENQEEEEDAGGEGMRSRGDEEESEEGRRNGEEVVERGTERGEGESRMESEASGVETFVLV
jgi:exonuclease III/ribonuclease HI